MSTFRRIYKRHHLSSTNCLFGCYLYPRGGSRVSSLPKKPSKAKQLGKIRSFKDWLKSSPSLGWSDTLFQLMGTPSGGWPGNCCGCVISYWRWEDFLPAIASMCYFTTQKKAVVTHLTCDDDPKVNHARGTWGFPSWVVMQLYPKDLGWHRRSFLSALEVHFLFKFYNQKIEATHNQKKCES